MLSTISGRLSFQSVPIPCRPPSSLEWKTNGEGYIAREKAFMYLCLFINVNQKVWIVYAMVKLYNMIYAPVKFYSTMGLL